MRDRIDKKGLIEGCLQRRREKKRREKKRGEKVWLYWILLRIYWIFAKLYVKFKQELFWQNLFNRNL